MHGACMHRKVWWLRKIPFHAATSAVCQFMMAHSPESVLRYVAIGWNRYYSRPVIILNGNLGEVQQVKVHQLGNYPIWDIKNSQIGLGALSWRFNRYRELTKG